jgi:hypothetical protein
MVVSCDVVDVQAVVDVSIMYQIIDFRHACVLVYRSWAKKLKARRA